MKPVDVNPSMYTDFNIENDKEGPKLKVDNNVGISKYKNIFAKGDVPNWSDEIFVIKKVKNIVPLLLVILTEMKLLGHFTKKNCKNNAKRV